MSLTLNGAMATRVRLLTPWSGPWRVDVEVPVAPGAPAPSGPALITVGESGSLIGTIDPAASGVAAGKAQLRVVAGAGGWERTVSPQRYINDGGLMSTAVIATTAAEVGERVVEAVPFRIGTTYTRTAGPASRVLTGLAWYVDARGITLVGPRPVAAASTDLRVLTYDAREGVAEIATTTELVTPGTVLTDERFGTLKVRDVEQTFGASGARARAWCMPVDAAPAADGLPGSRMVATLAAIAREAVGLPYLRAYRYRVVSQAPDGRVNLQSVDPAAPVPNLKLVELVPGVPGVTVKLATLKGPIVHVVFVGGEAVVRGFEDGPDPLEVALGATLVKVGGTQPVALAPAILEAFAAVAANAGLTSATMTTALAPILPRIASTVLTSGGSGG